MDVNTQIGLYVHNFRFILFQKVFVFIFIHIRKELIFCSQF